MMILRRNLLLLPLLWFFKMPSEAVRRRNRAPDVGMMDGIAKKLVMTVCGVFVVAIYSFD